MELSVSEFTKASERRYYFEAFLHGREGLGFGTIKSGPDAANSDLVVREGSSGANSVGVGAWTLVTPSDVFQGPVISNALVEIERAVASAGP